ncbi:hypothetical protein BN946_scf184649.g18 [Trametes cinnabarina]|uniref:SET domain-containing protein n=1 Tax=Pycnoporus cinnabarinus TaxID=5643 RepID=A0A060SNH9_PYCCI|nr:hypothetical protein BN946_scf184649.g18 [Trametes cinnabarina]
MIQGPRLYMVSILKRFRVGLTSESPAEPSLLRRLVKAAYLFLLAGGIYNYCTRIVWKSHTTVPAVDEEDVYRVPVKVTQLPGRRGAPRVPRAARQRAAFYNLSYVNLPTGLTPDSDAYNEQLALAIFQTNAVAAGRQGVGIFPRMARLNHGCSRAFDVVYTWRDDEGALVVHALKPIRAGEELLTTYTNTKRPRHVRREFLQEHYGFECQCAVCSLPDDLSAQSDERLNAVSDLYTRFSRWQHQLISGSEAAAAAISIWRLGEEEGYWSERGQLASDVTHVACAHSE